jgi:hypothetical protein
MIGASNSLITMQLIEGSNQMDYLLVLLDFHYYFPSQMIWAHHWKVTTLCTRSLIAFACGWYVVTCSLFVCNAIIVLHTHLFELTVGVNPILKDNKLRSWVTYQPGVMKQILDRCCWLICGFNNFKPTSGWIYHCECKQMKRKCVLDVVLIVNGHTRPTQTMTQGSDSAILGGRKS